MGDDNTTEMPEAVKARVDFLKANGKKPLAVDFERMPPEEREKAMVKAFGPTIKRVMNSQLIGAQATPEMAEAMLKQERKVGVTR